MPSFHAIRVSVLAQPKNGGKFPLPFQASSGFIKNKIKYNINILWHSSHWGSSQHFQDHVYCSTLAISTTYMSIK